MYPVWERPCDAFCLLQFAWRVARAGLRRASAATLTRRLLKHRRRPIDCCSALCLWFHAKWQQRPCVTWLFTRLGRRDSDLQRHFGKSPSDVHICMASTPSPPPLHPLDRRSHSVHGAELGVCRRVLHKYTRLAQYLGGQRRDPARTPVLPVPRATRAHGASAAPRESTRENDRDTGTVSLPQPWHRACPRRAIVSPPLNQRGQ
jgi:hypothetical protein